MAGQIEFRKIETPAMCQEICERLLARMFPDFHPVNQAGGDRGIDGFASWGDVHFQFTHPRGNVALRKFREDLEKAKQFRGLRKWYFLCSVSLSADTWAYLESQRLVCPFDIVVWEGAKLKEHLSRYPELVDEFFTHFAKKAYEGTVSVEGKLDRMQKNIIRVRTKPPRAGDAPEGQEIDAEQRQDIHDLIIPMAEEEAHRRHRKQELGVFISKEWAEFNKHFGLSAYDRLPKGKFGEAVAYLREKLHTRRNNEPKYMASERERKGIYGMAKAFGWTDEQRRDFYRGQTGKDHLADMSRKETHIVFQAMRRLQDAAV